MTITSEFYSWLTPSNPETAEPPAIGSQAPSSPKITLESNKRTIISFLRHCGCPFAEKAFIRIREAAKTHRDINFIAVSHSTEEDTRTWLKSLPQYGSEPGNLQVVVDDGKEAYAAWVSIHILWLFSLLWILISVSGVGSFRLGSRSESSRAVKRIHTGQRGYIESSY